MNNIEWFSSYVVVMSGVFGLLIGSFLNVVVYRVPAGASLVPGSRCPNCDTAIRPWQNVPVLSWLVLRGKCAACKAPISLRYPLVEAGTGLAFAVTAWWWLNQGEIVWPSVTSSLLMLLAYLFLAAVSIALGLIDLDTSRLPDVIVLPSLLIFVVLAVAATVFGADPSSLGRATIAGGALALFYGLLWFFWPGGMGLGDVKLAALLGFALGWLGWGELFVGAFAAFVLGGIFSMLLILLKRAGRGTRIPFGPWMLLGAWLGIFSGAGVATWYLSTFVLV